jgi:transcription initiation factor TFIID subunit 10
MKSSGGLQSDSPSLFPQPAPPAPRNVAQTGHNQSTATNYKVNDKLLRNKDVNDFMVALDGYAPTLPTEVVYYYLGKGGANIHDPRAVKMVSLAADKFMADILFDARQFNLLRQQSNNPRVKRKAETDASTLQFDDLVRSLRMRGVHIHRSAAPRDAAEGGTATAPSSSSLTTAPPATAGASGSGVGEGAT